MRLPLAAGLLLLAIAIVPRAVGTHPCDQLQGVECVCYNSDSDLTIDRYYVVNDELASGWAKFVWIYEEANSVPNLQRHDPFCFSRGFNTDDLADRVVF